MMGSVEGGHTMIMTYDEYDMGYYDNPDGERWAGERQARRDNEIEAQMEADYEIRTISGSVPGADQTRAIDPRREEDSDMPF
jgi:hypothetical protein